MPLQENTRRTSEDVLAFLIVKISGHRLNHVKSIVSISLFRFNFVYIILSFIALPTLCFLVSGPQFQPLVDHELVPNQRKRRRRLATDRLTTIAKPI
jgi:hypothetical protein